MEIGRAMSLLVALACLVIAYFYGSSETFHLGLVVVVLPLGGIWYGNEIGSLIGMGASEENAADNILGMLITVSGWIVLLGMLALVVFIAFFGWD